MGDDLRRLAVMLGGEPESYPWHELTPEDVEALKAKLQSRHYARRTVNHHLSALRGVLASCCVLGLISYEQYLAIADVENVR